MSAPTIARQPAGAPTGGQFAATARGEADVDLADVDEPDDLEDEDGFDDDSCSDCGADLSDGEGYDGLCGECADAAEAEGRWDGDDDDD